MATAVTRIVTLYVHCLSCLYAVTRIVTLYVHCLSCLYAVTRIVTLYVHCLSCLYAVTRIVTLYVHCLSCLYAALIHFQVWAATAQSIRRLATGLTVWGSNLGGCEIFRTRPDRSWGLPSLLYNGYRLSLPGIKRPRRDTDHPLSHSAEDKEIEML